VTLRTTLSGTPWGNTLDDNANLSSNSQKQGVAIDAGLRR